MSASRATDVVPGALILWRKQRLGRHVTVALVVSQENCDVTLFFVDLGTLEQYCRANEYVVNACEVLWSPARDGL